MSRNTELDTLLPSGQFVDVPSGVITLKNSVNRLITWLEENKALIQKKTSNVNAANAQPVDDDEAYEFFEEFEEITKTEIDDI